MTSNRHSWACQEKKTGSISNNLSCRTFFVVVMKLQFIYFSDDDSDFEDDKRLLKKASFKTEPVHQDPSDLATLLKAGVKNEPKAVSNKISYSPIAKSGDQDGDNHSVSPLVKIHLQILFTAKCVVLFKI